MRDLKLTHNHLKLYKQTQPITQSQIEKRRREIEGKLHAEGTKKAYRTAAKQWEKYCRTFKIETRQYNETNLIKFLTWLEITNEDGVKPSTVKNKLYGVREYAYQKYGDLIEVDKKNMYRLSRYRAGLAIENPASKGSEPITLPMCRKMITAIDQQPKPEWEKQTEKTLIILGFSEIKRAGEYVQDKQTNRALQHGDLTPRYNQEMKQTYYAWKRTDGKTNRDASEQTPLYSALVCKCKAWGYTMCPVHNILTLIILKQRAGIPTGATDHILVKEQNGQIKPYNKYMAGQLLKRMVTAIGIGQGTNDPQYTLHGLRKGGAIQAKKDGVPTATIMKQADWKSSEMVHYYQRQINIDDHATNLWNRYR